MTAQEARQITDSAPEPGLLDALSEIERATFRKESWTEISNNTSEKALIELKELGFVITRTVGKYPLNNIKIIKASW